MRKYIYIIICVLCNCGYCLNAQNISINDERQFKIKALQMLDDYETYAAMTTSEDKYRFIGLFADRNTEIYNDLIGLSSKETINVTDYADLLSKKSRFPKIEIKNVKGTDIISDGTDWIMSLIFDKSISYANACGVLLSSDEYYDAQNFKLDMQLAMNKETGRCTIKSLSGSIDSSKPRFDIEDYYIVNHESNYDDVVLCNGKTLEFNSFKQAFVPRNYNFFFSDPDVLLKTSVEDEACRTLKLSYVPRHWRLQAHGEFSLGDFYKADGNAIDLNLKSSGTNFGLDVGYVFPSKSKVKFGIFSGLGFSLSKIDLSMDELNYSYDAYSNADIDGDNYSRHYELSDITSSISTTDLVIPIALDLDISVSRTMSIYAQAGLKGYFNLSKKFSNVSVKSYCYGIYPQYSNLRLDENWGYNDFGNVIFSDADMRKGSPNVNGFTVDLFGGLGCRVKITGPLYINIGANFQSSLNNYIDNTDKIQTSSYGVSESSALITYTNIDGSTLRDLSEAYESYKRQSLNLNVGLMIKF